MSLDHGHPEEVLLKALSARQSHLAAQGLVVKQKCDMASEFGWVTWLAEEPGHTISDCIRQSTDATGDDQATELITLATEQKPHQAAYHSNFGVALRGRGRLDEAADALRQALRLGNAERRRNVQG